MKSFVGAVSFVFFACSAACGDAPSLSGGAPASPGRPGDVVSTQDLSDPLGSAPPTAHVLLQQGVAAAAPAGANLVDHGGRVLPASDTVAIWWGPAGAFPADAQAGIDAFLQGLDGSLFLAVAQQYMRGAPVQSTFVTNWSDPSAPPRGSPSTATIVGEACKMILANGASPDPNAIYLVYTSNFPGNVNFCAWHDFGTCGGTTIQVAYMPNTSGVAGCDPGNLFGCNGYSEGTRSLANVTSHEAMEAFTDATLSAWYDPGGQEIGDKCAWQFQSCVTLGGTAWQLQEEWSNADSACLQAEPPPPPPPPPAPGRLGYVATDGTFWIKEGSLYAGWVDEYPGVAQAVFTMSRIGVLDASGNFWVKEPGLYDGWVLEYSGVVQGALAGDRIGVVLPDGTALVKEGLYAGWVTEMYGVSQMVLSPNRIGVLLSDGTFDVKEGNLYGGWVTEYYGVTQAALTDTRIGVLDGSGSFYVKEPGLYDGWVLEHGSVVQAALIDDRIGVLLADGSALTKEGSLYTGWVVEETGVAQIALGPGRIGVLKGGAFYAKEGSLYAQWVLEQVGATQIAFNGD
jgi:hypothetical protein